MRGRVDACRAAGHHCATGGSQLPTKLARERASIFVGEARADHRYGSCEIGEPACSMQLGGRLAELR